MDLSTSLTILISAAISILIYGYLLYPVWISPLAKIPNAHPTSAILPLWILWVRYQGRENKTLLVLHQEFGPIIRLAPNEISVDCIDNGVKIVYGKSFHKHRWYTRFRNYHGMPTLFTILPSDLHSKCRQKVSPILSQSFLQHSPDLMILAKIIIFTRLLPIIEHYTKTRSPLNMTEINDATAVDLITGFVFGSSVGTNLLQNPQVREEFLTYHRQERSHGFWRQEVPLLTAVLKILGVSLVSSTVVTASKWLEAWFIRAFRTVEVESTADPKMHSSTQAIMYRHLLRQFSNTDSLPTSESPALELVAELHDHCVAGYETTGQMLTRAMYALSSRRDIQNLLRSELHSFGVCPFFNGETSLSDLESIKLPTPTQIADLPLLHAIIIETLRLRDRSPLPRVTPHPSVSIAGSPPLPPSVRVSAASYVLHHDPQVFPSPSEWHPFRWFDLPHAPGAPEKRGRMGKSFIAFGSGARTCVGRDLAMFEMKAVLAAIYANYETTLVDRQAESADLSASGMVLQQLNLLFAPVERSPVV